MTITYENQLGRKVNGNRKWDIDVRLDGKIVGEIRRVAVGYHYKPNGGRAGVPYPTIELVKLSIEDASHV